MYDYNVRERRKMRDQIQITPKLLALNYSNFSQLKPKQKKSKLCSKATEMTSCWVSQIPQGKRPPFSHCSHRKVYLGYLLLAPGLRPRVTFCTGCSSWLWSGTKTWAAALVGPDFMKADSHHTRQRGWLSSWAWQCLLLTCNAGSAGSSFHSLRFREQQFFKYCPALLIAEHTSGVLGIKKHLWPPQGPWGSSECHCHVW